MVNYLEMWAKDVFTRNPLEITKEIYVKGIQKKHLGPRLEYAVIELKVEPSDCFRVEIHETLKKLDNDSKELIDAAIFGILDVILTHNILPLRNLNIHFLSVDIHAVDSNIMAFRKAGRDAGRKMLENFC